MQRSGGFVRDIVHVQEVHFMSQQRTAMRRPSAEERQMIECLARLATAVPAGVQWVDDLAVEDLDDGGMGSLRLWPAGVDPSLPRVFGAAVAETQFVDEEGVAVIVTLYVDRAARPFELDVWRTNFSPRPRPGMP
jgi:hypothetical protein